MSIIKSIKQVLGLGPAAENHFWDGSVPNQLSLKRGTPDAPGAELIKAVNGVLSFPNQPKYLVGSNGYYELAEGLIIQWGLNLTTGPQGQVDVYFPKTFPNAPLSVVATIGAAAWGKTSVVTVANILNAGFTILTANEGAAPANESVYWIAIGY